MEIIIDFSLEIDGFDSVIDEKEIKNYIETIIYDEFTPEKSIYLSIAFVGNNKIKEINNIYRGKNMPTDVISFAYHETEEYLIGPYDTLGDIIISLERVEQQCSDYNHSFTRELFYVITHGMLHLLGYDHINEDDKKEMRIREEELLSKFGYIRK